MTNETRYNITIVTSAGTINPLGVPLKLERITNRADELEMTLYPFDQDDDSTVDLTVIDRDDTIELKITDENDVEQLAFFGDIQDALTVRGDAVNTLFIRATDRLRLLGEVVLNRAIFNGVRDSVGWEVDDDLRSNLKEGIKPIQRAERWDPQGHRDLRRGGHSISPEAFDDKLSLHWDTAGAENRVAHIFRPKGRTITKIWVQLVAKDGFGAAGTDPFFDPFELGLKVALEDDGDRDIPEDIVPGTEFLKTRSGLDAIRRLGNTLKETWKDTSVGLDVASPIPGSDLVWAITKGGVGGSVVDIIDGTGASFLEGKFFGFEKFCLLNYDGTDAVTIETSFPSGGIVNDGDREFDGLGSPSGWVTFQVAFSTTTVEGELGFKVDSDIIAAKVIIRGNDLILSHGSESGNVETTFVTDFDRYDSSMADTKHRHWFWFRVRPERLEFDFYYGTAEEAGSFPANTISRTRTFTIGENFDFLDRNTHDSATRITKYFVEASDQGSSSAGDIFVGFVTGNEVDSFQRSPAFCCFDFSDDPVDVPENTWIASEYRVALDAPSGGSKEDGGNLSFLFGRAGLARDIRTVFTADADGAATWLAIKFGGLFPRYGFQAPIFIEYADTWIPVEEGEGFIGDYDNKQLDWRAGQDLSGVIKTSFLMADPLDGPRGPATLPSVRVSEYSNPSQNGITQAANKMRIEDVIEYLIQIHNDRGALPIASSIVDAFYDTDTTGGLDVYVMNENTILEALRDLAGQFFAHFFISPAASPDFNFEQMTEITLAFVTDNPTVFNPQPHEYVLSLDAELFSDDDAFRVVDIDIGVEQNEVWNVFPVIGADSKTQVVKDVPHTGRDIIRPAEVFSKEVNEENLWKFAEALARIYGGEVREGVITIADYSPLFNGRLDINGIFRVLDSQMKDGTDTTGLANVFRITKAVFNGENNTTQIHVTNRKVHNPSIEELTELRSILNARTPTKPRTDIRRLKRNAAAIPAAGDIFFSLNFTFASPKKEFETTGYIRIKATQRDHDDGRRSYIAFFPPGNGSIPSDNDPAQSIRGYRNERKTENIEVVTFVTGAGSTIGFDLSVPTTGLTRTFLFTNAGGESVSDAMIFLADEINSSEIPAVAVVTTSPDGVEWKGTGPREVVESNLVETGGNDVTFNPEVTVTPDLDLTKLTDQIFKFADSSLHFTLYLGP